MSRNFEKLKIVQLNPVIYMQFLRQSIISIAQPSLGKSERNMKRKFDANTLLR